MKRYENRDKKSAIPFLKTNKKSPLNFNEIDINLLMSNPKVIHRLLDKDAKFTKKRKPCEWDDEDNETEVTSLDKNEGLIKGYINKDTLGKPDEEGPSKSEEINELLERKWKKMKEYEKNRPKGKALNGLVKNPIVKKAGKLLRPIVDFQF